MSVKIAVLASGGGTNLQAILDFYSRPTHVTAGEVVLVASNRADAGALVRARNAGVPAHAFDPTADGASLLQLLREFEVDFVVLAGYLKRVPASVIAAYNGRIINIHPGLLPQFGGPGMYGAKVHEAVLASRTTTTGVTIHLVDDEYDHGPVVAQWRVPVHPADTPSTLGARVLEVEHLMYPRIVDMVAALTERTKLRAV